MRKEIEGVAEAATLWGLITIGPLWLLGLPLGQAVLLSLIIFALFLLIS